MNICMVTGAVPGVRCGVEDYTFQLAQSLTAGGTAIDLVREADWTVAGTRRAIAAIRAARPDIVHIQYPALGYGASIGPHLLAGLAGAPVLLTLHEYSAFRLPKRSSLLAFAIAARHIIFTTGFERDCFLGLFPWCRSKSSIVPIGSNIPFLPHRPTPGARIAFFGQLRPDRGLEACLELARLAKERGRDWRVQIIGGLNPEHRDYLAGLGARAAGLDVEWLVDLEAEAVAQLLSRASAVYLPYPDGVSERRGTLMAALGNQAAIVTTDGPFRPSEIEQAVRLANGTEEAFEALEAIIDDAAAAANMRAEAARLADRYDWGRISEEHLRLYARFAPADRRSSTPPQQFGRIHVDPWRR